MNPEVWPKNWPHDAPELPLSTVQAHQTLRSPEHDDCTPDTCARTAAAVGALADEKVR